MAIKELKRSPLPSVTALVGQAIWRNPLLRNAWLHLGHQLSDFGRLHGMEPGNW